MILITGASGFLGGYIVDEFLDNGFRVRAMAQATSDLSHLKNTDAEIVIADITDSSQVKKALTGITEVVHSAALLGTGKKRKEDFLKVNYEATKNLIDLCIKEGIKRFTFISSIAAVGPIEDKTKFIDEKSDMNPSGAYGESKGLAEEYLLSVAREGNIEVVIVRPALIYGPRDKRCAVNYFRIANIGFFPIPAPADNKASFIYVTDAAKAVFLAHTKSAANEIYMLASDITTLKDFGVKLLKTKKRGLRILIPLPRILINATAAVIGFMFKITGRNSKINKRIKEVGAKSWAVNNSKIKNFLGFTPEVELMEGLKKTWDFYSKNKKLLNIKYLFR